MLVVCLILVSTVGKLCKYALGLGNCLEVPNYLFDVKMEANVPTMYSAAALLFCAFLVEAVLVDRLRRNVYATRWWVLASIFLYLAVDELFKLHERLGMSLGRNTFGIFGLDPGVLFRRSWVLYGIAFSRSLWA